MAKLSDKDREKIIKLLAEGKDLPISFRAKLFANNEVDYVEATKDYKLVYKGKTPKSQVIADTPAAPLQEIRSFKAENKFSDKWANMLIFGDNLYALKAIYEDQREANKLGTKQKIKLIYIDPPFATKQDFMKDREKAYRDKVIGAEFIEFLRKRLTLMCEVLADDGSIYVHLDWKKGHYIKVIMDEVFGEHNFLNHIAWCYKEREISTRQYNSKHDYILFYTKNKNNDYTFNWKEAAQQYSAGSIAKYNLIDESGRYFQLRGGGGHLTGKQGLPLDYEKKYADWVYRDYLDEKEGIAPRDWWADIPFANRAGVERKVTGNYPTQKSEKLLERIIRVSSKIDDIVLDAFNGSGTTLAVAEKLGRRWIGMDCGKLSIYTAQKRLLNLTSQIGSVSKDERRDYERVEDFAEHSKTSRGLLMIYEKAKAGDLIVSDSFLTALGAFVDTYLAGRDEETFSLVCPTEKFQVRELEVIDNEIEKVGQKIVKVGRVKFLISFISPKEKPDEPATLSAKHFKLFNAGMYDNNLILKMDWEQYKPFVAQLFDVRLSPHKIKALAADGYIGTHSAYIWNYPDNKRLEIDEEYVIDLHKALGKRAGDRFYVVSPVNAMRFMQDEIKIDNTTYVFLKVPLSVLIALIQNKKPGALQQPVTEKDVNEIINATGFDFVSQPVVKAKYRKIKSEFVIDIDVFKSNTLAYDPEEFENFETLSMVLIDANYNEKTQIFNLDRVFWSDKIVDEARTKAVIRIPDTEFTGKAMMVIFMDKYGNEYKVVKKKDNFS